MHYISDLKLTVAATYLKLKEFSKEESERRPAFGKWSPKEIIGHLIDSASNNHQRFVRAQFKDDLIFPGYQQDAWVALQNYQKRDWHFLIEFWKNYNLHLAHVMENISRTEREKLRIKHNLHQIAWKTVPENKAVTLDYFMNDYVGHLKHHLNQIFEISKKF